MTELRYNNESREFINLPHIGPIDVPKPIIPDDIIFRGQADSNWALTPSLFRSAKLHHISSPQGLVEREYENLIKFQKFCDRAGVQIPGDSFSRRQLQSNIVKNFSTNHLKDFWHEDFIEIATFAQHFGLETSFLDWSRNILTASYFASMGAMNECMRLGIDSLPNGFSIWVLNNTNLDPKIIKLIEPPKSINNHISYQNGLLTVAKISPDITRFPNPQSPAKKEPKDFSLESVFSFYKKDHLLLKLNIPFFFAEDIFNYCDAYNFNACNLFRGAHGAVQHFKDLETLSKFST